MNISDNLWTTKVIQLSILRSLALALLFIAANLASFSQKTTLYLDSEIDYKTGIELFQKEKYTAAQRRFEKLLNRPTMQHYSSDVRTSAEYYVAACAFELFNKDAEKRLLDFVRHHLESPKQNIAKFLLGKLYYRNKDWKQTLFWLNLTDVYQLSDAEKPEYYFKQGYSYFQNEDFDKAKLSFKEVKDFSTRYGAPALYYYSHITYNDKKYETAYIGFKKLENDEIFAPIVPFYIAQILYLQEKYDDLIAYAPPLLSSSNTKRVPEIAKILGEAYYRQGNYAESLAYLEQFEEKSGRSSRMDKYQLGYAYYRSKKYSEAIKKFETIVNTDDSLSQLANYHSADCYLYLENKAFARNSFRSASKPDFYRDVKEDALFNYAKLAYDLSYNPYNEAIIALEEYLKKFPESPRHNDVYNFLTDIYVSTRNYDAALASMEKINPKDLKIQTTFQKAAFYRGIEHFNNGEYNLGIELFNKSYTYPIDAEIISEANFWEAESYYRSNNYIQAKEFYEKFLSVGLAMPKELFPLAEYGLAYCYFKEEKYSEAAIHFQKFINITDQKEDKMIADAFLRTGDCLYSTRDFGGAINFYDRAIKINKQDVDYAMFQVAMCFGVLGKNPSKVEMLKILTENETSRFIPNATFELAETYLLQENYVDAEINYNKLLKNHPNSHFAKASQLAVALIYYNSNQDEKAIPAFKKVVENYAGSPEANEAIMKIQKIYVDNGDIDQFEEYTRSRNITNIAQSRLDSATYQAAEKLFLKADYSKASSTFSNYLQRFPNGYFFLKSLFGKAESAFLLKETDSALVYYGKINVLPKNDFTEHSLLREAAILYNKGNYSEAVLKYSILEEVAEIPENLLTARTYLMRSYEALKRWDKTDIYASLLLKEPKVSPELSFEAKLLLANSALISKQFDKALEQFMILRKGNLSKTGAESQYNIAYIQYIQEKHKDCEKSCFDLINNFPAYETWLSKGFILLSDNYLKMNDSYQAKFALQSLIDNSEDIEMVNTAKEKLITIISAEEKANHPKTETPVEINLKQDEINSEKIEDTKE